MVGAALSGSPTKQHTLQRLSWLSLRRMLPYVRLGVWAALAFGVAAGVVPGLAAGVDVASFGQIDAM